MSATPFKSEPSYPTLLLEEDGLELIQCSLLRVRIIWQGKPQGWRKFFTQAVEYAIAEGMLKP